jgi:hypothetical protein
MLKILSASSARTFRFNAVIFHLSIRQRLLFVYHLRCFSKRFYFKRSIPLTRPRSLHNTISSSIEFQLLFDSPDELARFYFGLEALVAQRTRAHIDLMRTALHASASSSASPFLLSSSSSFASSTSSTAVAVGNADHNVAEVEAARARVESLAFHNPLLSTSVLPVSTDSATAQAEASVPSPIAAVPSLSTSYSASSNRTAGDCYASIPAQYKIAVVTWNLAGKAPRDEDMRHWLPSAASSSSVTGAGGNGGDFDIIAVGVQECLYGNPLYCEDDMTARMLAHLNQPAATAASSASASASLSTASSLPLSSSSSAAAPSAATSSSTTTLSSSSSWSPSDFYLVAAKSLWEIRLFVFARRRLQRLVHHLQCVSVATGFMNVLGNKGACAIAFRLANRSLAFVSSHLAPHHGPAFCAARNRYACVAVLLGIEIRHDGLRLNCQSCHRNIFDFVRPASNQIRSRLDFSLSL